MGFEPVRGNFAFTHFAEGRAFARFLFERFPASAPGHGTAGADRPKRSLLSRGAARRDPAAERERYAHRLAGPAGIRKRGPWVATLSD
jgi:hypothetical protein